jgi:hypothetical protein
MLTSFDLFEIVAWLVVGTSFAAAVGFLGYRTTFRALRSRDVTEPWAVVVGVLAGYLTAVGAWIFLLPYLLIRWAWRRAAQRRAAAQNRTPQARNYC